MIAEPSTKPALLDADAIISEYVPSISVKTLGRMVGRGDFPPAIPATTRSRCKKLWNRVVLDAWVAAGCEPWRLFQKRLAAMRKAAARGGRSNTGGGGRP